VKSLQVVPHIPDITIIFESFAASFRIASGIFLATFILHLLVFDIIKVFLLFLPAGYIDLTPYPN
jgi:hypothetical protein